MAMSADFLEGLNPAQHDAVTHPEGPVLVIAGAGSGKTRVLTHRIAWLISQGVSPFEILAITFTNKAADEMKQRVARLVGPVAHKMWVSTFHSACVRILRRDGSRLGFPSNFTIYDQADAVRLTGYVVRDLGLDPKKFPPRSIHAAISALKNDGVSVDEFATRVRLPIERRTVDVYREYQLRLLRAGAMDFDDLLVNTVELFKRHDDALAHYRQRFKHVLVDEYQDTNHVQNEMVVLLTTGHRRVFVVGDSDQSIYQFRGANIRNILEFEQAFPEASVVLLEQNYRSTQTILNAANSVIAHNMSRKPKELWTDQGDGEKIVRYHADEEADEAQWVAYEIDRLHSEGGFQWGDIAVFYRTNAQSRALEEYLVRVGINYKVIGGTRFYDRREIKDALAYLRAVVNPSDEVNVKRILNVPKRGIGDSTVAKVDSYAKAHGLTFLQALRDIDDLGVRGPAIKGVHTFVAIIDRLAELVDKGPATLLEAILEDSGYLDELNEEKSIESEGRLENLSELVGFARSFETVDEFLEQVSLVSDTDEIEADETYVVLMTLHSAKGLEFPVVFLMGMEEGIFPHMRSIGDPEQLEEERRLAYVGITRARQRLYLTYAWSRTLHGSSMYNPPSRFLDEIPAHLVTEAKGSRSTRERQSANNYGWSGSRRDDDDYSPAFGRGGRVTENREQMVEAALRAKGVETSGAETLGLRIGDDVRHAKYGEGVILDISGQGDKAEARVRFPTAGERSFLLAWTPLEKI